jgi:hypothetical protein
MNTFLTDRIFLKERLEMGIDVFPSEVDLLEFEKMARTISPNGDFSWRGCQSCVNYMVKFVFDNAARLEVKTVSDGEA